MNNQDVRKHLRKGELAVAQLESVGWSYDDAQGWIAPVAKPAPKGPVTVNRQQLEKWILKNLPELFPCEHADLKGKVFGIKYDLIPSWNKLVQLPAYRFMGAGFRAIDIREVSTEHYTGTAVEFAIHTSRGNDREIVWVPIEACYGWKEVPIAMF